MVFIWFSPLNGFHICRIILEDEPRDSTDEENKEVILEYIRERLYKKIIANKYCKN
jgi:alpha-D-ribose 1-methylphosphonate 5-triphosphate synthase subunit PhnL